VQCVVIIDMAYALHEWWLRKIEARNKAMEAAGWQPGVLSNCWAVSYLVASSGLVVLSITALGVLFKYFGQCSLSQFFLAMTLLAGIILLAATLWGTTKGVLVPATLFAYTTYLVYGAVTNNPDGACNLMASTENKNQASIITGLVIAVISITYAAYSSATSFHGAVLAAGRHAEKRRTAAGGRTTPAATWPAAKSTASSPPAAAPKDIELGKVAAAAPADAAAGAPKTGAIGTAAAYADDDKSSGGSAGSGSALTGDGATTTPDAVEPHPWLFHLIMTLGGLYLAMLLTNWGDPSAHDTSNPELSLASMWVRIVSQWIIYLLYIWSLIAPSCCPNRDFD